MKVVLVAALLTFSMSLAVGAPVLAQEIHQEKIGRDFGRDFLAVQFKRNFDRHIRLLSPACCGKQGRIGKSY